MEYRDWTKKDGIGRDISTSLLGYGCMRFPPLPDGRIDEVRAEKLLNTAREAGVNYFDTAFPYHGGESEPFVGRVIAKWPRESFYLATKLPLWSCKTLDEAKAIFEKQFERLGVDYIDESEVLTPADERFHIAKHDFETPFVCGARNLGEALRRIAEGAAMIRTKGEPGTGNVVEAVRHCRVVLGEIRALCALPGEEVPGCAKEIGAPLELVERVRAEGRLPVVNFAAGGISTPADAALMMQLGCDGVFVGSGIFKSGNPAARARAVVAAVTHYDDYAVLAEISANLGEAMPGLEISAIAPEQRMQERGW